MTYKLKFLAFIGIILIGSSCQTDDIGSIPNQEDNIGAITLLSIDDPASNFFNALEPLSGQTIDFELDVDGFGVTEVSSVDVEIIYTAVGRLPNPDPDGDPLDQVFDPIVYTTVSSFPQQVSIEASELATALGVSVDSFRVGDGFRALFPINTADGRTLRVAVNSDLCQQPAQPSFGGCNVDWGVTCPVASDFFVGSYEIQYASGPEDSPFGFGPKRFSEGIVEVTASGPTQRAIPVVMVEAFPGTLNVDLICGETVVPVQAGPANCNGNYLWGQGVPPEGFSTMFDLEDDSEMIISVTDDVAGDCGLTDNTIILRLVKQ